MSGLRNLRVVLGAGLALAVAATIATPSSDTAADVDVNEAQEDHQAFMNRVGLVLPAMNSANGRTLFLQKGCVVCHAVNGIGGEDAPPLNASDMPVPMNPFEFSARMWRGAPTMVVMQEYELGSFIDLTGQELVDLIAFFHDAQEQKELTEDQVPARFQEILAEQ